MDELKSEYAIVGVQGKSKLFTNLHKVKKYAVLHTRNCPTCNALLLRDFPTKHNPKTCLTASLKSAIFLKHNPTNFYICAICFKLFRSMNELQMHMSDRWSIEQLQILGYPPTIIDVQPRKPNQAVILSMGVEAQKKLQLQKMVLPQNMLTFFEQTTSTIDWPLQQIRANSRPL